MEFRVKVNELKLSDDGTVIATMGQCDEYGNAMPGGCIHLNVTEYQGKFLLGSIHYVELVPKELLAPVA